MTDHTLFDHRTAAAVPVSGSAGGDAGVRNVVHRAMAGRDRTDGTGNGVSPEVEDQRGGVVGPAGWDVVAALFTSPVVLRELSDGQLEDRLDVLGRAKSRLAALDAKTVAELARRKGEAEAADLLRNKLKQSRGSAKREVKQAGQLSELPSTAEALAAGTITPQHARLIAEAAEAAPGDSAIDEAELLAAAVREPADLFGRTVRNHLNDLSGDDLEERRKHQRAQRRLSWKQQPDGMFELFGRFDPVAGSRIEAAVAAMASSLWRAEDPKNRPAPQRRMADALELLITRSGDAGKTKGTTQGVDLLVIADYDTLLGRLCAARLVDGTPVAPEELLRLACDANILPAIFDRKAEPLWLGRAKRHASARQRAVLAERDKGCIGCGASANWCQAHHIVHWAAGGTTDLDNLCLLCSHCHHQVHERGARVVKGPGGGFTLWYLDPQPDKADREGRDAGGRRRRPFPRPPERHRRPRPDPSNNVNHPIRC